MKHAAYSLCPLLVIAGIASAQWSSDPNQNNPISTTLETQRPADIVSDGAGGAIILWEQDSIVGEWHIYAHRIDAAGFTRWTPNGVPILSLPAGTGHFPQLVIDGAGGAIIAWYDNRGPFADVFAQRIDADGAVQWTANGLRVTNAPRAQYFPSISGDGQGGAIIAYNDNGNELRAQRISPTGVLLWPVDGSVISADLRLGPVSVNDGSGGAIIAWEDDRNSSSSVSDIYVQRITAAGSVQWTAGGVAVCTTAGEQTKPTIIADGAGGAIVAWQDRRNGTSDIYAQRINAAGLVQWTTNGVVIATVPNLYSSQVPRIASDGAGGAIIAWEDRRNNSYPQVYAQRIDNVGMVQWTANGILLSPTITAQAEPAIVGDGAGAYITWSDLRSGGANYDIYAQRIDDSGVLQWDSAGVAISTASSMQRQPHIADGGTGAIIAWRDQRNGLSNPDIYAQRVLRDGTLDDPTLSFLSPAVGDTLIAGEPDTIWWSGHVSPVDITLSVDSGRTYHPITLNYPTLSTFYSWDIPDTIISRWCAIKVEDANNPSLFAQSGIFMIKGYQLHRFAADSNYERFRFEQDRWNFGNNEASIWPASWYGQFNYQTGIDPNTGVQYPQIAPFNTASSSDFPDWPLFVTAFGVSQAYFDPPAMTYRDNARAKWGAMKSAWGGSCSGFAISSTLAFDDSRRFRLRFAGLPAFESLFSVPLDASIRKIINELWVQQSGMAHWPVVIAGWDTKTPNQTVNELKQLLWSDDGDHAHLNFWHNGPSSGGHAVVPYKLVRDAGNPAVYWIHVYDNSFHNDNNARIRVDTSANGNLGAWSYDLWPGWGGNQNLILSDKASTYLGNPGPPRKTSPLVAGSNTLQLYPT
ncbi:MAG: hypothetical protein WBB73_17180, partial [Candidatus Aminicenantaceae bacterium]